MAQRTGKFEKNTERINFDKERNVSTGFQNILRVFNYKP